jgi:hypothetical protein
MKLKEIKINKTGKLFTVTPLPKLDGVYCVEINDDILNLVGGQTDKKFESYLRKSFRHFYNLDKKLNPRRGTGKTRAKVNSVDWIANH